MVSRNVSLPRSLVSKAESLLDSTAEAPDEAENPSVVDGSDRVERVRDPSVSRMELDRLEAESVAQLDGAIVLLRAESGSPVLDEFERAVREGDREALVDLYNGLAADAADEAGTVADLTYHGETVLEHVGATAEDDLAVGLASFKGGNLELERFEVREHVASASDAEYEYRVLVVPPTRSEAERDASASAPDDLSEPAVKVTPKPAAATMWLAAGVVVGVALAGSGKAADPDVGSLDQTPSDAAGAGASFADLADARERLQS